MRVNAASSLVQEALGLLQKSQGTQKVAARLNARLQEHFKACTSEWSNDNPASFRTVMQKNYAQVLTQVNQA